MILEWNCCLYPDEYFCAAVEALFYRKDIYSMRPDDCSKFSDRESKWIFLFEFPGKPDLNKLKPSE